jgi:hypothetical protein
MFNDFNVAFLEPYNRDFVFWSHAMRQSMVVTIPCEKGGLLEFQFARFRARKTVIIVPFTLFIDPRRSEFGALTPTILIALL